MVKQESPRQFNRGLMEQYAVFLQEQEKSAATIQKYMHDLALLQKFLARETFEKADLIAWKAEIVSKYAAASVNTMVAALNGFLEFCDWSDWKIKPLKIQRSLFCDSEKELNRNEYMKLVRAAELEGNERLSLVIQTICATGIRVSELQYVTAEAIAAGRALITNKGKRRTVFLPNKLCLVLRKYLKQQNRTTGPVFVTRSGKPLDRSNIWRDMKRLCETADVYTDKVFPHNLRHLFARTYYAMENDLSRLADILGHSNINTTRIYTVESGYVHAKQMDHMGLLLTT